jgi:3-oxoacyl-[acyl-carrier-protein] synthase-3
VDVTIARGRSAPARLDAVPDGVPGVASRRPRPGSTRAAIAGLGYAPASRLVTTAEVEARIRAESGRLPIPIGTLEAVSGIRTRHMVADGEYSSTLAVEAGRRALVDAGLRPADIELLIFAATSQDQVEPATAHIVADGLGVAGAMVFDVKNACNSFVDALRVADSMLRTGVARRALVVTGETPSVATRWSVSGTRQLRDAFVGYTVGDMGGAAVLEATDDGSGIFYGHSWSASEHWQTTQVPGGGSRHPRGDEWTYSGGDGARLREICLAFDPDHALRVFRETDTTWDDYALVVVHQVTVRFVEEMAERLGIPLDRLETTVADFGNVAAATLPLALGRARESGRVRRGDRVLFFGLGAGISVATLALTL